MGTRDAVRSVRDILVADAPEGMGIPYIPEQPSRGPGADIIGRTASLLVELPVDLQAAGWRLAPSSGRDSARGLSYLGQDLDEVAEAYEGYVGPLKIQVCGPWSLAASLWLPRGEKVVSDAGASRDVAQSLSAGVRAHVAHVRRLVPGAAVIVQIDEPLLPPVLAGTIRTVSGMRRLAPVDPGTVGGVLAELVSDLHDGEASTLIHSCAANVPIRLVTQTGTYGISLDMRLVAESAYDALGQAIDGGTALWAGITPGATTSLRDAVRSFQEQWSRIGFSPAEYGRVVMTPSCGLAGFSRNQALDMQRGVVDASCMLREVMEGQ